MKALIYRELKCAKKDVLGDKKMGNTSGEREGTGEKERRPDRAHPGSEYQNNKASRRRPKGTLVGRNHLVCARHNSPLESALLSFTMSSIVPGI